MIRRLFGSPLTMKVCIVNESTARLSLSHYPQFTVPVLTTSQSLRYGKVQHAQVVTRWLDFFPQIPSPRRGTPPRVIHHLSGAVLAALAPLENKCFQQTAINAKNYLWAVSSQFKQPLIPSQPINYSGLLPRGIEILLFYSSCAAAEGDSTGAWHRTEGFGGKALPDHYRELGLWFSGLCGTFSQQRWQSDYRRESTIIRG